MAAAAKASALSKSAHLHTDDFCHYLCKGALPPLLPGSEEQNLIVTEAFLEAAKRFARGGYDVVTDGIIGPWFLSPWLIAAQDGCEVHDIVLRAGKEETLRRAAARTKPDRKTNIALAETMRKQFSDPGCYESNVIDTTDQSIRETVCAVKEKIEQRSHLPAA